MEKTVDSASLKNSDIALKCSSGKAPIPFLKWVGGKRSLLPTLLKLFPSNINTYYEPFLGGGAVFFSLDNAKIKRAILSDMNEDLITTYIVVKNNIEELISTLHIHQKNHFLEEDYYYKIRAETPVDKIEIASRFIYLNKTCFNGLYRVNKKGVFNVPKGSYKNPCICNEDVLRSASRKLQIAQIKHGGFENITPSSHDFVYCDPPYDATFTKYQAKGFTSDDQERLRDFAENSEARFLLSNSDTPFIRNLYRNFKIEHALAPRSVNSKATGRGKVQEIIASNF